jgi:hypothetical protein
VTLFNLCSDGSRTAHNWAGLLTHQSGADRGRSKSFNDRTWCRGNELRRLRWLVTVRWQAL